MPKSAKNIHQKFYGLTAKIPVVPVTFTLGDTQSYLLSHKGQFDTIDYIYVADPDGKLVGVSSIKDIYRNPASTKITAVKKLLLVTATLKSHPEEIAYLALRHGIKAVPIIDAQGKLLGIIPHDSINRILYRELREDILQMAGVSRGHVAIDNIFEIPLLHSVRHRLPWLIIGMGGGLAIAQIIGQFEETLRNNMVLAAFVPLIVYIADAVGTQMEAFVIRDFALFRKLNFGKYFIRQLIIVLILALILGIIIGLTGFFLYRRVDVASVLGLAVAGSTLSALFSGLIIPLLFRKMNTDPANASGPLGTIIQDAASVVIYFSIASILL